MEQPISFLRRVRNIRLLVRTGATNNGSLKNFNEKSWCPQNWKYGRTVQLRLWRNGKVLEKALGKLRGASWGVYWCFRQSRRVHRRFPAINASSETPSFFSHGWLIAHSPIARSPPSATLCAAALLLCSQCTPHHASAPPLETSVVGSPGTRTGV